MPKFNFKLKKNLHQVPLYQKDLLSTSQDESVGGSFLQSPHSLNNGNKKYSFRLTLGHKLAGCVFVDFTASLPHYM